MSVDDFRDDDDLLKLTEKTVCNANFSEQVKTVQAFEATDPTNTRWQIIDDIPERVYTIQCDGHIDKDGQPLNDETSIKYLTNGEQVRIDSELEICDENGNVIDYCMVHSK